MGGIRTPIEIESNLSWERLYLKTFTASPVNEEEGKNWKYQIPRTVIRCQGFTFLVGVKSNSALSHWRLGCTVQYASYSSPDSLGIFNSDVITLTRIEDRKICLLNSYTLCIWPDLNASLTCLIIEFPHWLQDATIEIFWYNGEYTGDFFSKLRESLMEIFGDKAYVDSMLGQYINSKVLESIAGHSANPDAHPQYLQKYEAANQYLRISDLDVAIADSDALKIALDAYLLKAEANAAFVKQETFNQERTFVDQAIQEAKDIAAADLAAHLEATNPHGITPEAIGAIEESFRGHLHDERYALINHSHQSSSPEANFKINSLQLNNPLPISSGGTGASTALQARINLGINYQNLGVTVDDLAKTVFKTDDYGNPQHYFEFSGHLHDDRYALTTVNVLTPPQLNSGWLNYGGAYTYGLISWNNFYLFQGLVVKTTNANNIICTLPLSQRPRIQKVFITWGWFQKSYMQFRIDITSSGIVTIVYPTITGVTGWISLDPLMWIAN